MTEQVNPLSFDLYAESASSTAPVCFIYVKVDNREEARISVEITDWIVPSPNENKGIGSMLLGEAILECRHRGVKRITGDLSVVDEDHFDELKCAYKKHGFTVHFFDADTINRNTYKSNLGKVELIL